MRLDMALAYTCLYLSDAESLSDDVNESRCAGEAQTRVEYSIDSYSDDTYSTNNEDDCVSRACDYPTRRF